MTWKVIEAPVGAKACDCYGEVQSEAQALALRADGFEAMGVYCNNVTAAQLGWLTAAGLGVFFILEGLAQDTRPTSSLGTAIATRGIGRLRGLGVPPGVTVAGDLEGAGRLPADWIDFGNGEADAIKALADLPTAYCGAGIGLTSIELYRLHFTRYWKSGSRVMDRWGQLAEPQCGWSAVQGTPFDIKRPDGLEIDVDTLWRDYQGRALTLMVQA